jgi:hypothetical protein
MTAVDLIETINTDDPDIIETKLHSKKRVLITVNKDLDPKNRGALY